MSGVQQQGDSCPVLNGSKRLVTALSGLVLAVIIGLVPSAPAQADPDIETVKARVDRLFHEGEQAQERYNDAKLELAGLDEELGSLESDQRRQDQQLDNVREQVKDSVVSQYEGQGLSAVGSVVVADDPGAFLSQMATMSTYSELQDDLFDDYSTELKALDIRRDATENRASRVAATKDKLAKEKKVVDDKLAEAEALLDDLKAEERERVLAQSAEDAGPADAADTVAKVPASGRAGGAVSYAMAQVGKSYVYGAAGPSAFDCSGLTMMAWAQAGVGLPHSSSAQYSSGPRVAESDLQPGDLVFYYSPISHVGMYIGNGMIVHAANPGSGVLTSSLHSMPYVGAVRPG